MGGGLAVGGTRDPPTRDLEVAHRLLRVVWLRPRESRMAKEKQQEVAQLSGVTRLAVSISKGADGKYLIEELRLAGDKLVKADVLVVKGAGLRVASGEMLLNLEERLADWQREGALK